MLIKSVRTITAEKRPSTLTTCPTSVLSGGTPLSGSPSTRVRSTSSSG